MRINLNKVNHDNANATVVSFESPLGKATAHWIGTVPNEFTEYDVEFEIPGVLTWGSEISATAAAESIYEEDGSVCLVGRIQLLGDDGVVTFALQDDIILVETTNAPYEIPQCVLIRIPRLEIFDTYL